MHNEMPLRSIASIDNYEDNSYVVRMTSLSPRHSGRISLKAANEVGEELKWFALKVLCAPKAPGRLEARNVGATSVQLIWEASREDKDTPEIEYYAVERKTAKHR
jgi:hypothetical protein